MVRRVFPRAAFLLVEAQKIHLPGLQKTAAELGARYVLAVAGDAVGELYFDTTDPFGGVASAEPHPGWERLRAEAVDHLSAGMPGPFLLKLDTHGFELPILRGASETLKETAAIVVEAYNFYLNTEEAVPFWRLCVKLEDLGFRCYDACEPMHRRRDGALWQMDLVFLPRDSPVFQDNNYR
jgi:FkbM family methyltransferase